MVEHGIAIEFQPWSPIFEKNYHLREKGGVLISPPGFVWWVVWAESPIQILKIVW
jgi:hypothetical protein